MGIGYLLIIGGTVLLASGMRADLAVLAGLGGVWLVAGVTNVAMSRYFRRRHGSTGTLATGTLATGTLATGTSSTGTSSTGTLPPRAPDLADPAARARFYRGVPGQLARALIAVACVAAAVGVGVFYPFTLDQLGWRFLTIACGAVVGFITFLGLLVYALSSVERSAVFPATVTILDMQETALRDGRAVPYIRFVLGVRGPGLARYEATVQQPVPVLAVPKLAIGAQFAAMVAGPNKPNNVIVDWARLVAAAPAPGAPTAAQPPIPDPRVLPPEAATADRLRELGDLRNQGLVTEAEYDEQRSRILDSL